MTLGFIVDDRIENHGNHSIEADMNLGIEVSKTHGIEILVAFWLEAPGLIPI